MALVISAHLGLTMFIALSNAQETSQVSTPIPPPNPEEGPQLKDIFFDSEEDEIRPDAESVLRENVETLKKNPSLALIIEGYSDSRGTDSYNLRLGKTRADATKAYLVELGIDPKRIKTVARGTTIKFSSASTEEAFQLNRRSHFILEPYQTTESIEPPSRTTDELPKPQPFPTSQQLYEVLEDELKLLAPKEIIFNPMREMKAGESQTVGVQVSKKIMENLHEGLKEKKVPETDKIRLGQVLKFDLSGNNFNIKTVNIGEESSAQEGFTELNWEITPLKTGTQSLLLTATVNIETPDSGNELKEYPLYVKAVKVKFNPVYSAIKFIKSYWIWIVGLIIVSGIVGWGVKR